MELAFDANGYPVTPGAKVVPREDQSKTGTAVIVSPGPMGIQVRWDDDTTTWEGSENLLSG